MQNKFLQKAFAPLDKAGNLTGFTLIEVVTAVFIITVGILGVFGLIQKIVGSASVSSSKLAAAYLAQEGVEIVRNIRDSNWLKQRDDDSWPWDSGLSGCSTGCEADYQSLLSAYVGQGRFLNIATGGFYSYAPGGNPTIFKRKITIEYPAAICNGTSGCAMEVTVVVSWGEKGIDHQFTVKDDLYKWH